MATFENPSNGYREEVTWASPVSVFLFGPLFLLFQGLWGHAILYILGVFILAPLIGFGVIIIPIIYAFSISHIKHIRYLQKGWREV